MLHDWVKHGTSPKENPWVLPEVNGRRLAHASRGRHARGARPDLSCGLDAAADTSQREHALVGRILDLRQRPPAAAVSPRRHGRATAAGRRVAADPARPRRTTRPSCLVSGSGLGMMQTLFSMEHNSIAGMLAAAHPEFDDETLFHKARLITCALIAKIHTVEWTPAVTAHPTAVEGLYANWWGLAGPKLRNFVAADLQERGAARHPRHRHRGLRRAVLTHRRVRRRLPDAPTGAGRLRLPVGPRRHADTRATVLQRADRAAGRPDPAGPAADRHHLHLRHDEPGPGHAAQLPERAADVQAARQRRLHGHGGAGHPAVP